MSAHTRCRFGQCHQTAQQILDLVNECNAAEETEGFGGLDPEFPAAGSQGLDSSTAPLAAHAQQAPRTQQASIAE